MKIQLFASLREKAAKHKILARIICFLLIAALGAGIYFGWRQYEYMQSGLYAFENLKKALQPPDAAALAKIADFNALSQDLAKASQKNFPFFMAGPDQERKIRHLAQTALLKRFLSKEESSKAAAEPTEEDMLKTPLYLLPGNFVSQLLDSLHYEARGPNNALVSAKIDNPLLKTGFTIVMNMDRGRQGWRISHIANAGELVAQLREAMLRRYAALRELYVSKNKATLKRMDQQLPIQSCTAHAGLLSDHRTLLLVVRLIARNTGKYQVNNFNVDASIINRAGKTVLRRYLNTAKAVAPGEDFDHSWTFDLDANSSLSRELLAGSPLQCKASWQTLGLSSAEVLHIVEVPNPAGACELPGHKHPSGFCMLPVFKQ